MKLIAATTTALFVAAFFGPISQAEELPKTEPIFNGSDFTGWEVPKDNIWFSAEGGILKVQSGPNKKGQTLWTEKEYTDFVMEFEFKMGEGTVDSGIFVRTEKEQIQIGISGSLKRDMTASPFIAGPGYPVEAEGVKELLKTKEWNSMRIVAQGKTYKVWLNGKEVMTYTSETAVPKGRLGIQLHGGKEMTIEYREIKAADLK
ncbi:MAG: DUF1080 domain-containing protein [Verrucomicrobiales bacterium]